MSNPMQTVAGVSVSPDFSSTRAEPSFKGFRTHQTDRFERKHSGHASYDFSALQSQPQCATP